MAGGKRNSPDTLGSVTISIDLELAWGCWDRLKDDDIRLASEAERPICDALISLFERHEVPATWAIVAALLDRPSSQARPGPTDAWFAPDIVERVSSARTPHEIGSHSGRHIYFDSASEAEAREDIDFAASVHRQHGFEFASFVYPRNSEGQATLLSDAGIRVFRGLDRGIPAIAGNISPTLGRAVNLLEKMLPVPPATVVPRRMAGMIDVPGSMLLMGRNGIRRAILPAVTRAKLGAGLTRAQRRGETFHFWFHPSNFYYRRDEQLATLDWFLGRVAAERANGRLRVLTLVDHANKERADG